MGKTRTIEFKPKDEGTPCSLMIPWRLYHAMHGRRKRLGMTNTGYVSYLVHKAMRGGPVIRPQKFLKRQYQEVGVPRKKWSVKADDVTWHFLKCLAAYHGMSACRYFVVLLGTDLNRNRRRRSFRAAFVIRCSERFDVHSFRVRRVLIGDYKQKEPEIGIPTLE